jgi:dTMP kinase
LLVTFEGPEGGGKSTQASLLVRELQRRGHSAILAREPGGTEVGERIRAILQSPENEALTPVAEALLFNASRAQLTSEVIWPHLLTGDVVVCDRFIDSTLAYQGYGQGLDLDVLKTVTNFATDGLTPDLTILLDLPVEAGLNRKLEPGSGCADLESSKRTWDRIEARDRAFHERVRAGFRTIVAEDPARWLILDGCEPLDRLAQKILSEVLDRLSDRRS